jgi:hypothetical protein
VSPPRQGFLLWETRDTQELPPEAQVRCRELLSRMLLAVVSGTAALNTAQEENDEREDSTESY